MIKWHHFYSEAPKDNTQRWGLTQVDCPPADPFLFLGLDGHQPLDIGLGRVFFRLRNTIAVPASITKASLLLISYKEIWTPVRFRIWGTTIYNQPQVTNHTQFDALPRTQAYVDYYCQRWYVDQSISIDITPIMREMSALGLIAPNIWLGFRLHHQTILYVTGRLFYRHEPTHHNEPSLHISEFIDSTDPSDPPPAPDITQPDNKPGLPPVFTPPPIPTSHALVLQDGIYWGNNQAHVVAETDEPCLMKLLWTDVGPEEHKKALLRRGRVFAWDKKYCFVQWNEIPEENPLPSFYHDFCWPDWHDGDTRWYRYVFIFAGVQIKPNTAFFWATYPGDAAWLIPVDPANPIRLPSGLTEEGLPCFGPTLELYEPWSWGGAGPPTFELFFTETWWWLGWPPPTFTKFFTEPWG